MHNFSALLDTVVIYSLPGKSLLAGGLGILGGTFDREVAVFYLILTSCSSCPSDFLLQWPTFSVAILSSVEWLCH